MSLWADYYKERFGHKTIEKEWGFASYSVKPPFICIEDMYIKPAYRQTGLGTCLLGIIAHAEQNSGCTDFWTQVWLNDACAANSLRAQLARGFKMLEAQGGRIILTRPIGG